MGVFPFAEISFGASAVNWLSWNDQQGCSQFCTQLYWQSLSLLFLVDKKMWISPGEKQKIGKREATCEFVTIATGIIGKDKSSFFVEQDGEFWCYVNKKK